MPKEKKWDHGAEHKRPKSFAKEEVHLIKNTIDEIDEEKVTYMENAAHPEAYEEDDFEGDRAEYSGRPRGQKPASRKVWRPVFLLEKENKVNKK